MARAGIGSPAGDLTSSGYAGVPRAGGGPLEERRSFDKNDSTVGTGLVGAPACGDVMKLQIKVDKAGKITDACSKTFGCGSAIASSSVATEWDQWVKGKQMEEVLIIKNTRCGFSSIQKPKGGNAFYESPCFI